MRNASLIALVASATVVLTFVSVRAIVRSNNVAAQTQVDALKAERDAAISDLISIRSRLMEVCAVPEFKNLKVWIEGEKK